MASICHGDVKAAIYPLFVALALSAPLSLLARTVQSPDGDLSVTLRLESGRLVYDVSLDGRPMLENSPLGLATSIGSFSGNLSADGEKITAIDEEYALPHGKVSHVHYQANELEARFRNEEGGILDVIFRVSDRDVAFRYTLSSEKECRAIIESEATGFRFPKEATAFVTPQAAWGEGFAKTKPSYEEGYLMDVPVGTKSERGLGFTFPALFRVGGDGWVLVSETGVTGGYVGARLADPTEDGLYTIAFPEKAENGGVGDATVAASLPLETPWRTITVGRTLAPIVETTVATDVVKPLYEATQDYTPGRATWSWILWQDPSMNWDDQVAFIDLAAEMGYEYILIDALWDANIGRERMADLVAYAASKKVGVFLWYNSNGCWNDAPQSPRGRLADAAVRRNEMKWLHSIGVKGLKVDFFGGDKQETMRYYEDILTDGNDYGLMLNFHGTTLPRGWERMFLNYMTSEAVTASENLVFSQGFADSEAHNSTIFPFVRNPVAPMDYGPVFLSKRFSRSPEHGNFRRTTIAFQLATAVLYQSPLGHFGITPDNLKDTPDFVIDFLKSVPAVWDETRYIAGYPGRYVALARRCGDRWFVAVTNGESGAKTVELTLPFLAGRECTLIHDAPELGAATERVAIGQDGKIKLELMPGGGAVICP
jgi:hypothetical protein